MSRHNVSIWNSMLCFEFCHTSLQMHAYRCSWTAPVKCFVPFLQLLSFKETSKLRWLHPRGRHMVLIWRRALPELSLCSGPPANPLLSSAIELCDLHPHCIIFLERDHLFVYSELRSCRWPLFGLHVQDASGGFCNFRCELCTCFHLWNESCRAQNSGPINFFKM